MRVLVLVHDGRERQVYVSRLRADGYTIEEVSTLAAARAALAADHFDCLVLDRPVRDGDPLDLMADVDALPMRPRVLILSAMGGGTDRADALELGADEYMMKPVHPREMALRVRNLLRTVPSRGRLLQLGRVVILRDRRDVTVDGTAVHLTMLQLAILEELALRAGQVVPKAVLIERCWVESARPGTPALHSQISRLRSALDGALVFDAVYGVGYRVRIP